MKVKTLIDILKTLPATSEVEFKNNDLYLSFESVEKSETIYCFECDGDGEPLKTPQIKPELADVIIHLS